MEDENRATQEEFVEGNGELYREEPAYNEDEMSMEGVEE